MTPDAARAEAELTEGLGAEDAAITRAGLARSGLEAQFFVLVKTSSRPQDRFPGLVCNYR